MTRSKKLLVDDEDEDPFVNRQNLCTTTGLFMTPDAISKCKEKDVLRAMKVSETFDLKEKKLRKQVANLMKAMGYLRQFLDAYIKSEDCGGACTVMDTKALQIIAKQYMNATSSIEVSTRAKVCTIIDNYMLTTPGAIGLLQSLLPLEE